MIAFERLKNAFNIQKFSFQKEIKKKKKKTLKKSSLRKKKKSFGKKIKSAFKGKKKV